MQDGTLEDNIPSRHVDCTNHFNHSPTRGTYLLDDIEVEALKQHPKVRYVNINHSAYPGSFTDNPDDFVLSLTKTNRYPAPGPWEPRLYLLQQLYEYSHCSINGDSLQQIIRTSDETPRTRKYLGFKSFGKMLV